MPISHTIFDELIIGSPLHIQRSIKLTSAGGVLEKCWLTVKENRTQSDGQALIKKSITVTDSADGQILNAGATGVGEFVFHLLPIDTKKLKHGITYIVDLWVKVANDDPAGIETGVILPHYAVTLDPS